MSIGVIWFGNDLRTADQVILWRAIQEVEQLICVYCDPLLPQHSALNSLSAPSPKRDRFANDGLDELARNLNQLGQNLFVTQKHAQIALPVLFNELPVTHVYRNHHPGWYEQQSPRLV